MKKLTVMPISIIICIIIVFGSFLQSCDREQDLNIDQGVVSERLKLSSLEFADIYNNRTNFEKYQGLVNKYGNTYISKNKLPRPTKINIVTKSGIIQKQEISEEKALNVLLNKNNVFQYDKYVIFVSQDGRNVKQMYATDYDDFLTSNPANVLDIPQNIVLKEAFIGQGNDGIPLIQTRSEADFPAIECVYCALGGIAVGCGMPAGLLELYACVQCYIKLKEYYKCNDVM